MKETQPPVRVAMVGSSLRRGGAEKQTVYFARALSEAGLDLRFYLLGGGGPHETSLRDASIPVHPIYIPRGSGRMLTRLTAALFRWQPDVVIVNQFGDLHLGALAGRCCGALVLGGVRSDGWYELRTYGRLSPFMLRSAHGFIANSQGARTTLISRGLPPRRIAVLPNVIELGDFDARGAQPGPPMDLPPGVIAAAVGSLFPGKRLDVFLAALARARRFESRLTGVIAGADGGVRTRLEEQAKALQLGPAALRFVGECDNVPALLSRVSMLVSSSDFEGFPNVILEAMAARRPVITTDAGDAGFVVQRERTGYVVNRGDVETIAACMVRLAQSPSLRQSMGQAGRRRVEQEYDYRTLAGRLIATIQQFAGPRLNAALEARLNGASTARETAEVPAGRLEVETSAA